MTFLSTKFAYMAGVRNLGNLFYDSFDAPSTGGEEFGGHFDHRCCRFRSTVLPETSSVADLADLAPGVRFGQGIVNRGACISPSRRGHIKLSGYTLAAIFPHRAAPLFRGKRYAVIQSANDRIIRCQYT